MDEHVKIYCRCAHIAVKYKSSLIIWGGYMKEAKEAASYTYHHPDELFTYSPEDESWNRILTKGDIPPENSGTCGVILDDFLYIFGGYYKNDGNSNRLYRLDLKTLEWKLIEPGGISPGACDKLVGWTYGGKIYFFGGFGPENLTDIPYDYVIDPSTIILPHQVRGWNNQLLMFDPETVTWSWPRTRGNPPKPRAAHAADISGDNIYVFGGRHLTTRLNDLHWLNMNTLEWNGIENLEGVEGRSWHSFSFIEPTKAIIYGGLNTNNAILTNLSIVDTNSLTLINSKESHPRLWHQAKYFDTTKELIIIGGYIVCLFDVDSDHAEEMLILHFGPRSLLRLCIESVLNQESLKAQWDTLPLNLQRILRQRSLIIGRTISVHI